jgi:hypothetical protein
LLAVKKLRDKKKKKKTEKILDFDSDPANTLSVLLNTVYLLVMNFSRKYRIETLEEIIPGFSKCGKARENNFILL